MQHRHILFTKKKKYLFPQRARPLSIRMQLMLFLCCISVILVGSMWFLSGQLLQPFYNNLIYQHLDKQLDEIVVMMDEAAEQGVVISVRTDGVLAVDPTFQQSFYDAVTNETIQLSDLCVNISDTSLSYVMYSENIYPCLLHGDSSTLFGEEEIAEVRENAEVVYLRNLCFEVGEVSTIVSSGEWQQMVLGKRTTDGTYVVFVSASLSQVVDAGVVLRTISPIISLTAFFLALIAALVFSAWFTRPISQLADASHDMAQGNYDILIPVRQMDEFGVLTTEFNAMASEVRRSAQLQRELLANVSHDLRTPLTLIRGYAETLRDITGAKKQKRDEQLGIIIDETERLTALVNSILELSKFSSGAEKHKPVSFDISLFCEEIAERYNGVCAKNDWTLLLDVPLLTPLYIYADPDQIERAIDNLLGNAMQHLGEDGVFILRAQPTSNGKCLIEIEDHGEGILPEEREHLFGRYYRTRQSEGTQGTGLGLSIARAIFQQHNFAFGVKDAPIKGTIFWFVADTTPPTS